MTSCLFCKILEGTVPADVVHESNALMVFRDIHPQAPQHFLIIPKIHIPSINEVNETHQMLLGQIMIAAKDTAVQEDFSEAGYRLVFNINQNGGQEIYHIHLHLLGGRQLHWPPG